jgi:hypothetical protein
MSTLTDSVEEGLAALKAGDRNRARSYFRAAILRDPRNEQAWLGLSEIVADQKERHYCLSRVIALNPNNQAALQALTTLTSDASAPTISVMSERHVFAASALTHVHIAEPKLSLRSPELGERNLLATTRVALLPPIAEPAEHKALSDLTTLQVARPPKNPPALTSSDLRGLTSEAQQNIARQNQRQHTIRIALLCLGMLSLLLAIAVAFVI